MNYFQFQDETDRHILCNIVQICIQMKIIIQGIYESIVRKYMNNRNNVRLTGNEN